ncbi:hypothetical protein I8F53_14320 (plasmid) [Enterococcus faecium]|nr:hypothetical protein I8F53_14320 [Enterococcus faecium]
MTKYSCYSFLGPTLMKFLFGGNDFIPLIILVEFNREAWRLLRNTFLDERQFFNGNLSYTKFSKEKGGIKESYFKQTKIIGGINHD